MAIRPVFYSKPAAPYFVYAEYDFPWFPGFAVSQSRKNIAGLHAASLRRKPDCRVLEISSKSEQPLGVKLSAFNLMVTVPSLGKQISVECAFQGSKVFRDGGPFTDLYEGTSMAAKKDPRLKSSGELVSFRYEGRDYPTHPYRTAFYDWLYINALAEHPDLAREVLEYDGFTDIAFNPNRGVNCQAKSAALFVSLSRAGLLEQCKDFDSFLSVLSGRRT